MLAERLNYTFLDLDLLIESRAGKSVEQIFDESGEKGFRLIERKVLKEHLGDRETVISTGGGTPCYEDNMELMNNAGLTVFLDTPVEKIIDRLRSEAGSRPLLKNIKPNDLPDFIRRHIEERRKYYAKASIIFGEEAVDALMKELLKNIQTVS